MAIRTFKHKGLKKFFETGAKTGIAPVLSPKLQYILDLLDAVTDPQEMDFPGSRFHPLKGDLKGFFAVQVNGNWRVIFRFEKGDAFDVHLVDYH